MLLKKIKLNKALSFGQKNSNLGCTSLMNYSSSKENKSPFPIKNDVSLEELFYILECLIRVEDKFSLKDHRPKSFKLVVLQLILGVIFLHEENVDGDTILKHLLEESKLLDLYVDHSIYVAMDMLKTVKRLELKHESFQCARTRLEVLLANLYDELKAATTATTWKEIRDELLFSLSLSYSSDRARIMLNAIEFHFPRDNGLSDKDYPSVSNSEMNDYVPETFLVTTEDISATFDSIYSDSYRYFLSTAQVKEQIQSSKKELRKRHVINHSILLGIARALRIMLLDNPKKIKVKKARIRNKKIKESKKIEEVKELEEPKDSE